MLCHPSPGPPALEVRSPSHFGKPLQKSRGQEQVCVYAREEPETRVTHQRLGGHLQRGERTPLCTDGGLRAQLVPLRPGRLAGLLSLWASSWGVSGVGPGQSQPRERAEVTTVSPSPTEPS